MNVKMTFTIPEDVADELRSAVSRSKRSAFVAIALKRELREMEREELKKRLIEQYIETREEDRLINEEWEAATLENWPEY